MMGWPNVQELEQVETFLAFPVGQSCRRFGLGHDRKRRGKQLILRLRVE